MAEITKSIQHHVSMGNYESVEFSASVTLTPLPNEKGTVGAEEIAAAFAEADEMLNAALEDDIKSAWNDTAESKSYIGLHPINYVPPTRKRGRR